MATLSTFVVLFAVKGQNNLSTRLIKCFSIVENYKKLKHYSPDTVYPGIHFIKIVAIIIIITEHRGMLYLGFPSHNTEDVEMVRIALHRVFMKRFTYLSTKE